MKLTALVAAIILAAIILFAISPAIAAPARVQGCTTQNGASSSATVVCTMGSGVGAGDLVTLFIGTGSTVTGVTSVVNDKGNTCTKVDEGGGVGVYNITSVYCPQQTAGATVYTATLASAATLAIIFGDEFSGISAAAVPLNKHAVNTQTTPGTGANAITSTSGGTASYPGTLVVAGTVQKTGAAGLGTITAGTGFTSGQTVASTLRSEYLVQGAPAAVTGTFTAGSASDSFDTAVMSFDSGELVSNLKSFAVLNGIDERVSNLKSFAVLQGSQQALSKLVAFVVLCSNPGVGNCPALKSTILFHTVPF